MNEIAIVTALDLELVDFPLTEVGNENFPDSRGASIPHGVAAAVPVIKIAGDAHALRVRSPDSEVDAAKTLVSPDVRTEPLIIAIVGPLAEKM